MFDNRVLIFKVSEIALKCNEYVNIFLVLQ